MFVRHELRRMGYLYATRVYGKNATPHSWKEKQTVDLHGVICFACPFPNPFSNQPVSSVLEKYR